MPARRTSYGAHTDWNGTGQPAQTQIWSGAEVTDTHQTIDAHAGDIDRSAIEWVQGTTNAKVFIFVAGVPVDYHGTSSDAASIEARKTTTPGTNPAVWTKTQSGQPTPDPQTMTFTA